MATTSYGWSSPGNRTVMASFRDPAFVTSTEGIGAEVPCAFAVLAEEPGFEPHELQKQTLPARTRLDRIPIRLIELLPAKDSNSGSRGWRNRSGDLPDRATAISLRLVPGPWKTPAAGSEESPPWQRTTPR